MPRRLKLWAALLLVFVVCLVLVMPQVDLADGVLKDVQNQGVLIQLMSLATALVFLLLPALSHRSHEIALQEEIPLSAGACANAILRC